MKYLLDTSVVLWAVTEKHRLNARALELLYSDGAELYLSAASAWEIAIKYAMGKLPIHREPATFIPEVSRQMGMKGLEITAGHAIEAGRLPRHHGDPFDRMLVAQVKTEGMTLLTVDRIFGKYDVEYVFCGR